MIGIAKSVFLLPASIWLLLSMQRVAVPTDDPSATVRFVDTTGNRVEVETALFFNGGRAKSMQVESGVAIAPSQNGIVVANAKGFQFGGVVLSGNSETVVLFRSNEPGPTLTQSPYPLTDEIKSEFAESLREKLWMKIGGQAANSAQTIHTVSIVAAIDPLAAIDWVKENNIPARSATAVHASALMATMYENPEQAFDEISQIDDPMSRGMILMAILHRLPFDDPLMGIVEKQALESSRRIRQPAEKLAARAILAEHYNLTARPALAEKIVELHREEVKKLPSGGWSVYPRSQYAALICEKDPELARELIAGIDDPLEARNARARVAFACCRVNPAMAIELLSLHEPADNVISVYGDHIKVAHRMAVEQTAKARELADSINEPNQRAWALGLMAMRLNKTKPKQAQRLLAKAIETLSLPAAKNQQWLPVGSTLAGLLPIAQQVDSAKIEPIIWQAVYETIPQSRWTTGQSNRLKIQSVAGAIARYDLELGRALLSQPILEIGQPYNGAAARQAALYPLHLKHYGRQLFETKLIRETQLLEQAVVLLTQDQDAFWRSVSKPPMLEWPTDRFENF